MMFYEAHPLVLSCFLCYAGSNIKYLYVVQSPTIIGNNALIICKEYAQYA